MATTAQDLIKSALRLINAYAPGETLDVQMANDALVVFQQMIDAWNADRLSIYTTSSNDFPFVLGKQSYTLGTGGDFNMARPAEIDAMSAILLYNPDNPVEEPITLYSVKQWQEQVPVKNVPGNFPLICYDDGNFPLRTLNFWPIPQQANSVRIYSWQPLSAPVSLSTAIALPPAYARAFRHNLAVELAPEFGKEASATVQRIALETLATIKNLNTPDMSLKSDLQPSPAGYNYKADLFGIGL